MKNIGGWPVVIGGDNLPSPVGIGLTDLPNIGGPSGPPGPLVPASLYKIPSESKTEKDSSQKGKHRVTGKEHSNFDVC